MTEIHTGYASEIYCHDAAGWRRDRIQVLPPDWVCELLSLKHDKRDLVDKLRTLHAHEVPHYWVINPSSSTGGSPPAT